MPTDLYFNAFKITSQSVIFLSVSSVKSPGAGKSLFSNSEHGTRCLTLARVLVFFLSFVYSTGFIEFIRTYVLKVKAKRAAR